VSFEKELELLSRDDRFKATIYAMNTLLIHKGIYTQEEFQQVFVECGIKAWQESTRKSTATNRVFRHRQDLSSR